MLIEEQAQVCQLMEDKFGYYLVEFTLMPGVLSQSSPIAHKFCMADSKVAFLESPQYGIIADFESLPFVPESLDLVILAHVLEFYEKPELLLSEIWNALIPNGYLLLLTFNPFSLWGLHEFIKHYHLPDLPQRGHYYSYYHLSNMLKFHDYYIDEFINFSYSVPTRFSLSKHAENVYFALSKFAWPNCGNVNLILARKQVAALTPIRLQWQTKHSPRIVKVLS